MPILKAAKSWLMLSFLFFVTVTFAQTVDLETLGKGKAFKLGGGISSNGVFYSSGQASGREPFTYFLQGNLNISFYQFGMPISYSWSNQGEQLSYNLPFNFNRLSLHPKYKWVQGHIGDVAMTFSPYTLNGHQFTGGGVELTPNGPWKVSLMAGRLLKATEDDGNEQTVPAFQRMGYGLKLGYEKEQYAMAVTTFYAKDNSNSIAIVPEEKGVTPKENMVVSVEGSYKLMEDLQVRAEYASSAITKDLRADVLDTGSGLAGLFLRNRASTEYYNALRTDVDYTFGKSGLGVGYERIDPGYETLGAYFFNNDFENITLNGSTTVFDNTLNLAFNIGYQQDNLENQKQQASNRTVGAVNVAYNASERLAITASYSNFTTFTNSRLDQFEVINDDNLLDDTAKTLNYRQLSRNANVNINYLFSKNEQVQQNLNLNYALADVSNEEDGVVRIGNASTFHNGNVSYTLGLPNRGMNLTAALNGTLNTIGVEDSTTWGPTLNINQKFLDNTLNANFGASYNTSTSDMTRSQITNLRANASYVLKKRHSFHLNLIQLFKNLSTGSTSELTLTFGHSYTF